MNFEFKEIITERMVQLLQHLSDSLNRKLKVTAQMPVTSVFGGAHDSLWGLEHITSLGLM